MRVAVGERGEHDDARARVGLADRAASPRCRPSTGIERSMRMTSGRARRGQRDGLAPSAAAPTTSMSPASASSCSSPARTTAWSSTSRTRIMRRAPPGGRGCPRPGAESMSRRPPASAARCRRARAGRSGRPSRAALACSGLKPPPSSATSRPTRPPVERRRARSTRVALAVGDDVAQRLLGGAEHERLGLGLDGCRRGGSSTCALHAARLERRDEVGRARPRARRCAGRAGRCRRAASAAGGCCGASGRRRRAAPARRRGRRGR